ncbi:hypothetical protein P389DRAFT_81228 [Cystobasidium minutum MCA 4210]|uniref:uncharacterized protein n=1 Tax=Cystobasidium minutum MCA 4210 TaxID=1397322 RepID=UPI0034CD4A23|eukprot:jgi/Rhomi1/81228/CE81227_95
MVKLRSGASYLHPVNQEVWTFDNLEPDFRFRYTRERIARMRGSIPGRTALTYRGVTLQDHWKPSEVNMRQGDTIFYFFDQPRVHMSSNHPN